MVNELLDSMEKKLTDLGDSKGIVVPAAWLKILNMTKDDILKVDLSRSKKHDQYFMAIYLKDKKPRDNGIE